MRTIYYVFIVIFLSGIVIGAFARPYFKAPEKPVAVGVQKYMLAMDTFDGNLLWQSFSSTEQVTLESQGGSADTLVNGLKYFKDNGAQTVDRAIVGRYTSKDGTEAYLLVYHIRLKPNNDPIEIIISIQTGKNGLIEAISD